MTIAPSGKQFSITAGEQQATIVEVGGGVREYTVAGRDVLERYPLDTMCDGAHGAPLIPWPNRLADGHYSFDGADRHVALTEPDKHNAIHGFLRWRNWTPVEHEPDRVVMATRLHPLTGYPFVLDVRLEYALSRTGLTVTTTATNLGEHPCPYGAGQHPYLSPGTGRIDECTLQLSAATRIDTDNQRQLPTGRTPTQGTPYDFTAGRPLGEQKLDYPFTDLGRDPEGRAWVRLTGTDGASVELWADDSYPIIELYTGDTLARPPPPRSGHRADDLPTQRIPDRRSATPPRPRTIGHHQLGSTPHLTPRTPGPTEPAPCSTSAGPLITMAVYRGRSIEGGLSRVVGCDGFDAA